MTNSPRRPLSVGHVRIVCFVKRGIGRASTQQLANALAPTGVSTPATTGFDLVRYAARIGGIGRAIETLRPLLPLVRDADLLARSSVGSGAGDSGGIVAILYGGSTGAEAIS
jgi:hypothetical protein